VAVQAILSVTGTQETDNRPLAASVTLISQQQPASKAAPKLDPRIVPDAAYPTMYRIRLCGGQLLSDMLSLTRAKDALAQLGASMSRPSSSGPETRRAVFSLRIGGKPGPAGIRDLRALLKRLLRQHGFTGIDTRAETEPIERPLAAAESNTNPTPSERSHHDGKHTPYLAERRASARQRSVK
jgi:hypothetical protein